MGSGGFSKDSDINLTAVGIATETTLAAVSTVAGATTDAKVETDAVGTLSSKLRGAVSRLAELVATAGTTTGAAVDTDAAGTLQQYLRGVAKTLAAKLPASLGTKAAASSLSVAMSTEDAAKVPALGAAAAAGCVPVVPATAAVTTVLDGVTMAADRTGTVVTASGRKHISIEAVTGEGAAAFDAVGVLKVLGGNTSTLTESHALPIPSLAISAEETLVMELETAFPYVTVFYDRTSDGDDDTITVTIAVS